MGWDGLRTVVEDPIHFTGAATTDKQYFLLFIFVLCIFFAHTLYVYIGIGVGGRLWVEVDLTK